MFVRAVNTLYIINNSKKTAVVLQKSKLGLIEFECLFNVTMEIKDSRGLYACETFFVF